MTAKSIPGKRQAIIDLAVQGALQVQSVGEDDFQVILVDPNRAAAPHEMVLLTSLFGDPRAQ